MTPLLKAVDDYLSLRRQLGYKLRDPGTYLHDFVSFLGRQGASRITTELALHWAMQQRTPSPPTGRRVSAPCGSSLSTTAHQTPAPRSRRWDSSLTGIAASCRTSTASRRSGG